MNGRPRSRLTRPRRFDRFARNRIVRISRLLNSCEISRRSIRTIRLRSYVEIGVDRSLGPVCRPRLQHRPGFGRDTSRPVNTASGIGKLRLRICEERSDTIDPGIIAGVVRRSVRDRNSSRGRRIPTPPPSASHAQSITSEPLDPSPSRLGSSKALRIDRISDVLLTPALTPRRLKELAADSALWPARTGSKSGSVGGPTVNA